MKNCVRILFILIPIIITGNVHSQNTGGAEGQIRALEEIYAAKIMLRDSLATASMQTENYFLAYTVKGLPIQVVPKQQWLAVLKDYITESFEIDDIKINMYGNMAVAMLLCTQKATVKGQDRSGQFVLTDVWIKEKDQWLIASRHSSHPGLPVNMQAK